MRSQYWHAFVKLNSIASCLKAMIYPTAVVFYLTAVLILYACVQSIGMLIYACSWCFFIGNNLLCKSIGRKCHETSSFTWRSYWMLYIICIWHWFSTNPIQLFQLNWWICDGRPNRHMKRYDKTCIMVERQVHFSPATVHNLRYNNKQSRIKPRAHFRGCFVYYSPNRHCTNRWFSAILQ